jgi:hypothetical protein
MQNEDGSGGLEPMDCNEDGAPRRKRAAVDGWAAMSLSDEESLRLSEELRLSENTRLSSLRVTGGEPKGEAGILDEDGLSILILGLRNSHPMPMRTSDDMPAPVKQEARRRVVTVPVTAAAAQAPRMVAAAAAPAPGAGVALCEWVSEGRTCGLQFEELGQLGLHIRDEHIKTQKKQNRITKMTGSRCYWRGCERPLDRPFNSCYNLEVHVRFQHTHEKPFVCPYAFCLRVVCNCVTFPFAGNAGWASASSRIWSRTPSCTRATPGLAGGRARSSRDCARPSTLPWTTTKETTDKRRRRTSALIPRDFSLPFHGIQKTCCGRCWRRLRQLLRPTRTSCPPLSSTQTAFATQP